jgi:hypothetical protein
MSWAETNVPDNTLASQRRKNTGFRSANQVEVDFVSIASGMKNSLKALGCHPNLPSILGSASKISHLPYPALLGHHPRVGTLLVPGLGGPIPLTQKSDLLSEHSQT